MKTMLRENSTRLRERRLTQRVEKSWRSSVDGKLPAWSDIQLLELGDDWDLCFAVDLRLSNGFPYFIFLGDKLCRFSNIYLSGHKLCEETLLDMVTSKMDEAALSREPVFYESALRLYDRRRIIFRSVLLPLSTNGSDVTHVFGAANGSGCLPND